MLSEPPGEDPVSERAARERAPLIDGDSATFVWRGEHPPRLLSDLNGYGRRGDDVSFDEVEPGVWTTHLQLPLDMYLEYIYEFDGRQVLDPFNNRVITDGTGGYHNYFAMPDAETDLLAGRRRGVARGQISRHTVESGNLVIGGSRTVRLYEPPNATHPIPLLIVLDGQDYLARAHLANIVDNLIAESRVCPLAMAFVNHGKQARFMEYDCSEATVAFLVDHVMPLAQQHLNLADAAGTPGAYGVLGASMGGLMALYTCLRVPHIFGRVLSQSGAFGFAIGGRPPLVHDLVSMEPMKQVSVWMDVGRYEFLLDVNRQMCKLLAQSGYPVTFREFSGAHNYTSWRNDIWRGLEAMFPPEV